MTQAPAHWTLELDGILAAIGERIGVPPCALRVRRLDGGRQNHVFRIATPGQESMILRAASASPEWCDRDAICAYLYRDFRSTPAHGSALAAFIEARGTGPIAFPLGASILQRGVTDCGTHMLEWSLSEDLGDLTLWKDDLGEAACRALAGALASLHSVGFAELLPDLGHPAARRDPRDWLRAYILSLWNDDVSSVVSGGTMTSLLDAAGDIEGNLVLTHGDLHGANVFIGPRGARLIDWDEAAVAHCERDLVFAAYSLEGMATPERAGALYQILEQEYARLAPRRISAGRMAFYASLHLLERVNVFAGMHTAHLDRYAARLEHQAAMLSRPQ
jgi:hypothetical protein